MLRSMRRDETIFPALVGAADLSALLQILLF